MKPSGVAQFHTTLAAQLTRPWKKYRDGTLFYGQFKSGLRRHPANTKLGNKNFYKGTGAAGMGRNTSTGRHVMLWQRVRTYVVPESLQTTPLLPLVSQKTPELKNHFQGYRNGATDGRLVLDKIKEYVQHDKVDTDLKETKYLERG